MTLACDAWLAPARWSRHVARCLRCPPAADADRFLEWLLRFGEREPGHVLYPTSDDLAFLVAAHRQALGRYFHLYSPPVSDLLSLLDKSKLAIAAPAAGLDAPETWLPRDEAEVERVGREASFPLLVKPRARVLARSFGKGLRVDRPQDLVASWREGRRRTTFHPEIARRVPELDLPMLQRCYPETERVYTVDGFVDRSGAMAVLGCAKLLQRPRRSGAGVLFEAAPVAPAVAEGLRRLFAGAGFHGVFDAEFILHRDRLMLIDVNPRFYNHMAFEIERGLPLAWLAYLGALGRGAALRAALRAAPEPRPESPTAYVHRLPANLLLWAQRIGGVMPPEETRRWRDFIVRHRGRCTNPARWPGDSLPVAMEALAHLAGMVRHPRSFLRQLLFDPGATLAVG